MRPLTILMLVSFLLALTGSCSGPPAPGEGGPRATLDEFYRYINDGDYATAMTLYDSDALDLWEDTDVGTTFADWAKGETRGGTVERLRVAEEKVTEDTADIDYEVVYSSGETSGHSVRLTREEGRWRLGLIG